MRRRLLNKMQTEQDELARSLDVKARLVPPVNLTVIQNEGATDQAAAQSSQPAGLPPQPAAPKRGWPKGKPRGPRNG